MESGADRPVCAQSWLWAAAGGEGCRGASHAIPCATHEGPDQVFSGMVRALTSAGLPRSPQIADQGDLSPRGARGPPVVSRSRCPHSHRSLSLGPARRVPHSPRTTSPAHQSASHPVLTEATFGVRMADLRGVQAAQRGPYLSLFRGGDLCALESFNVGMSSERTYPEVLDGRDDHGWASSRPPAVPQDSEFLIDQIVAAVRTGDDPAIRRLLAELAPRADVAALLRLRERLYADIPATAPSPGTPQSAACERPPSL